MIWPKESGKFYMSITQMILSKKFNVCEGESKMNILVTGGTVFASRYTAEYFRDKGNNVYVLNI